VPAFGAWRLGGGIAWLWVLVEGTTWQPPGERHEGGTFTVKGDLHTYLREARKTSVWKLDGLGDDIRRPMTPTGTNLLGLAI